MRAAGLTGESDLQLWFAQVLRDGIAAAAAGGFAAFKEVNGTPTVQPFTPRLASTLLEQLAGLLTVCLFNADWGVPPAADAGCARRER